MKNASSSSLAALVVVCLSAAPILADIVTFAATGAGGTKTPVPLYNEISTSWSYQSVPRSTVSPTGNGCRSTTSATQYAEWSIAPTLGISGGTYIFQITHGSRSSGSTDVVVNISVIGGTLTSGGSPVTSTTAFQQAGANTWETVGTLTLNSGITQPTITFSTQTPYTNRIYVDGFQFSSVGGCESGLPRIEAVKGPLAAGQTLVTVPDVSAGATKVSVYANSAKIGERTTGVVAGDNLVTVTPLVKGQQVIATQTDASGIESCKAAIGGGVGGGANPNIRVVLNIRENIWIGGPIGRDGTEIAGDPFFLGASASVNGKGTAPLDGLVISPGYCWQTVTFNRDLDPSYGWTYVNPYTLLGDYGVLDGIGFALQDNDNGPYVVYLDNITNGDVLIQDFETGVGEQMFTKPSTSTWTDQYLMPVYGPVSPDFGEVVTGIADSGSRSFAAYWQFKDLSTSNWLLLQTYGADTPQPVVDLSLPISFRILVLPVGVSGETGPTIIDPPDSVTVPSGGSALFHVGAAGTGALTYQWLVNNEPVGTNSPSLTLSGLTRSDNGTRVCVIVCDATGSTRTADAIITIPCRPHFADVDGDNDVDMRDFAAFQVCFSGPGFYVSPNSDCGCFDRDPTGPDYDVDADDLAEFIDCFTGPSVLWTPILTPDCQP